MKSDFYSVEWLPEKALHDCWNQYAVTNSLMLARMYQFNLRFIYARSHTRFRIRKV